MERYSGHTNEFSSALIGNWFEDKLKTELESKEMTQKQGMHPQLQQYQAKLAIACKPVALCDTAQRSLCYGDIIMLQNAKTQGVLSTDADKAERIWRNGDKVLQSTTSSTAQYSQTAMARNSFVILPPTASRKTQRRTPKLGDTLHYGQAFTLCIHESLCDTPFYLHSEIMSHLSSADSSRDQMVVFHPQQSSSTNWQLHSGDHANRVELDTTPVMLNNASQMVLKHCNTQTLLASDTAIACGTDFGTEYQTACSTYNPLGRIQVIKKELVGLSKDARGELAQNKWSIIDQSALLTLKH